MPAIDPNLLQCVFYIYPDKDSARSGEHKGGSGFFVARQLEQSPPWQQLYAVTNRHCKIESGGTLVLRVTKKDGTTDFLETRAEDWIEHPDLYDVAVYAIDLLPDEYNYNYVSVRPFFITPQIISNVSIGPGDDVFMVGRFITDDGKERNLPTTHFGSISRMNSEPTTDEYGIKQDSFLAEMRSLPGFSGSPVFVFINPLMPRPPHFTLMTGTRQRYYQHEHGPWLLGVDWSHISHKMRVSEPDGTGKLRPVEPPQYVEAVSGMAGVIPAWRILEILESPEMVMQREQVSNRMKRREVKQGVAVHDFSAEKNTQTTEKGMRQNTRS